MESTGQGNRIQLSQSTADLLIKAGKASWIQARRDQVDVKGKGIVQTYWAVHSTGRDDISVHTGRSSGVSSAISTLEDEDDAAVTGFEDAFDVWEDENMKNVFTLPPMSKTAKKKRLVSWMVDMMAQNLKRIVAQRLNRNVLKKEITLESAFIKREMVKDEVVEAFSLPQYQSRDHKRQLVDPEAIILDAAVLAQLHGYITAIADLYKDNNFHNFEHAAHVTMSSQKLLGRIVTPQQVDYNAGCAEAILRDIHKQTFGITSDELAQFAVSLSALVHDVDHPGVPNPQLAKENPELADKYKNQSIAEQNSIDISWDLLMDPNNVDLQNCLFANDGDVQRFRQYVVNLVMATDIFDKDMTILRNQRWDKAFTHRDGSMGSDYAPTDDSSIHSSLARSSLPQEANLKATIVLEHIIQVSSFHVSR